MNYYDDKNNVKEYVSMMKNYDNGYIISHLENFLDEKFKILELGSGPGKDYKSLYKKYNIFGSDNSNYFVEILKEKFGEEKILKLNAIDIKIDVKMDLIYSNKVLQHIEKENLEESFKRQSEVLKTKGISFHTFWLGHGEENYDGLIFNYYTKESLEKFYRKYFEVIKYEEYQEERENDSFYIVLIKKVT